MATFVEAETISRLSLEETYTTYTVSSRKAPEERAIPIVGEAKRFILPALVATWKLAETVLLGATLMYSRL